MFASLRGHPPFGAVLAVLSDNFLRQVHLGLLTSRLHGWVAQQQKQRWNRRECPKRFFNSLVNRPVFLLDHFPLQMILSTEYRPAPFKKISKHRIAQSSSNSTPLFRVKKPFDALIKATITNSS